MGYQMMKVQSWKEDKTDNCTIEEFCDHFNVASGAYDENFGLIRLTAGDQDAEFVIMINEDTAEELKKDHEDLFDGPYSNPQPQPFG